MLDSRVVRDLERQVDVPHVYTRAADLAAYAYDAWGASGERHLPDAVVFPASTEEVAGVVEVCAHYRVPVVPRRAGTGYAAGGDPLLALLSASEGTLAVITEVSLRLLPAPAARATLAATFTSIDSAAGTVAEIAGSGIVPAALEFLDAGALDAVRRAGGTTL